MDPTTFVGKIRPQASEHSENAAPKHVMPSVSQLMSTRNCRILSPQPSNDPNDPLNWPMGLKVAILIQTSILAALGGLNTATINPALSQLSEDFGISTVRASYQTTVCIALNGVAPWLWIPFAHKYGRRPVYLASTLLAWGSALGASYAQSYTQLLVARVFNGLFPVAFALAASTITDLFFYHQRGRATGVFTVIMATGAHVAPIIGGLIGEYLGWRWIFKFLAILDGVCFVVALFCLPETMHVRSAADPALVPDQALETRVVEPFTIAMFKDHLRLYRVNENVDLSPSAFVLSTLRIMYYPSIIFPALYYATIYGFASILPAVTVAAIFKEYFGWPVLTIGLTYGAALTLGGILGECVSGWVLDRIIKRAQAETLSEHPTPSDLDQIAAQPPPEARLKALWVGNLVVPAGLLMYGFTLQYHAPWFSTIFAIGLACFGLQIVTTTTYTYSIDSYKARSSEVAQVFNFVRQEIGFTFAFYVVDLGHAIGYQWVFLIFAICGGVLAFIPVVGLMICGPRLRQRFSIPECGRE